MICWLNECHVYSRPYKGMSCLAQITHLKWRRGTPTSKLDTGPSKNLQCLLWRGRESGGAPGCCLNMFLSSSLPGWERVRHIHSMSLTLLPAWLPADEN